MASFNPFTFPISLPKPFTPSIPFFTRLSIPSRVCRVSCLKTLTLAPNKSKSKSDPFDSDDIAALNERIRRELRNKESCSGGGGDIDSKEAEEYIRMVKQQQQRGLQKLRGDAGGSGGFGYRVDPYTLRPGDYVVHKKVGIGRFVAIKYVIARDSSEPMEYVFIDYGDGMAKLPVKQAGRMLYRYNLSPNETKKPRALSKINDTSAWERRRIKGKIAIQKMVVDLMELYLHRLKQKRPLYPKNTSMIEFAAQFPYEPTPDQKQAFIDVEKDLTERETPMDRLICGDVGFGKTEVALRAIFCVVSAGKQAMVLAPTIVLAKQHFDVISERFSRCSHIKVGILSRFQTKVEKEEYLSMIKQGHLDIIVGTHALLGNRVVYNNLGLLVVDEEQRFGVKQKEKIASFKTSVDVLTLSGTPIPRTLYLALTGFRDASLISTPPPERVPIRTSLASYSEDKVLSAIKFELDRVGLVFYVLPRIKGLEEVKEFLEESFTEAAVAVAHGKYVNYLENPIELINEAEKAAEQDMRSLVQFTEQLRRQYGKEPRSMEVLLKKLYVRRMAADLGIKRIYTSGKVVGMTTNMSKKVFKLMMESMTSDIYRNYLDFTGKEIKAELLLELPRGQLLNWFCQCLAELYASLPALVKY